MGVSLIPPFTLYGKFGCDHCSQAEKYLRAHNIPTFIFVANEDPIISEGIKSVTGEAEFPVLLYRPTKEIIVGFKEKEYERVIADFVARVGASTPDVSGSEQQSVSETQSKI
jgi:glutaredoxin